MSEEKEYPSYDINIGVATQIESLIKIKTFKYHPYGLEDFRNSVVEHINQWQNKGLAWCGHDQLTHAWRTPWDTHIRYNKLMSPIVSTVLSIINTHSPERNWWLKDCWISEYTQSSAANKHNHGDDTSGWSFCYYIKVPDNGPGFTLCDDVQGVNHQLNIAEGDLLIFKHSLHHQVFPSTDRRIIISGNIHEHHCHDVLMESIHYNENFISEDQVINSKPNEIDINNWNEHIFDQKFNVKVNEGY